MDLVIGFGLIFVCLIIMTKMIERRFDKIEELITELRHELLAKRKRVL